MAQEKRTDRGKQTKGQQDKQRSGDGSRKSAPRQREKQSGSSRK